MLSHRQKTVDDLIRQSGKYNLRVLEECKRIEYNKVEIPKSDRLEIRKYIRNHCAIVLELFRKHRCNPNLIELQVSLRKYITRRKRQLQNQLIESFKISAANSPNGLKTNIRITDNNTKTQKRQSRSLDSHPQCDKLKLNDTCKNQYKNKKQNGESILDTRIFQELSRIEKENVEKLLGINNQSSDFLSKTLLGGTSSRQPTVSDLVEGGQNDNKYRITPMLTSQLNVNPNYPHSSIFTDPKILQQCRQILNKIHIPEPGWGSTVSNYIFGTGVCSSASQILLNPLLMFGGKQAETVMDEFFQHESRLSKNSFGYRMQEYIRRHLSSKNQTIESIEKYFLILSNDGLTLQISRFGKELDENCMKKIPADSVRKLFNRLDPNRFNYLAQSAILDQRWLALFNLADTSSKGIISYWDLYGVRKSWQFISFNVWYQQFYA